MIAPYVEIIITMRLPYAPTLGLTEADVNQIRNELGVEVLKSGVDCFPGATCDVTARRVATEDEK